jgi:hypothetical protein
MPERGRWRVSVHFTRAELIRSKTAQERGIDNSPPEHLLAELDFTQAGCERIRAALGFPMIIHSGYRCPQLNDAVGGSPSSQHMAGQAVDFTCPAFGSPLLIVERLKPLMQVIGIDQMILEKSWVHVSFTLQPRYQALRALLDGTYETV